MVGKYPIGRIRKTIVGAILFPLNPYLHFRPGVVGNRRREMKKVRNNGPFFTADMSLPKYHELTSMHYAGVCSISSRKEISGGPVTSASCIAFFKSSGVVRSCEYCF